LQGVSNMRIPFFFESWCVPNCATFDVFGLDLTQRGPPKFVKRAFGSTWVHNCSTGVLICVHGSPRLWVMFLSCPLPLTLIPLRVAYLCTGVTHFSDPIYLIPLRVTHFSALIAARASVIRPGTCSPLTTNTTNRESRPCSTASTG